MRALCLHAVFILLVVLIAQSERASGQPSRNNLTVEEVVNLVRSGFTEELIITRIRKHGKSFDLSTEELVDLRKAGVNENIIKFLLDPSQPYTPPPPPAPAPAPPPVNAPAKPAAPPREYPADAYAKRVPPEPGLYYFRANEPQKLEVKVLLGVKQGAGVGKILLKKGRTLAYLAGPSARVAIPAGSPVFYMRLPEGKGIEEYVLVTLDQKSDRRELDTGPGPKPELEAEAIRQYESVEVGAGVFRVAPVPLKPGEYMFLQIGSAEPDKGSQGRGFEFSVPASPKARK